MHIIRNSYPRSKGPFVIHKVSQNGRFIVKDIQGFQCTWVKLYKCVICVDNMKHWIKTDYWAVILQIYIYM